MTALTIQPVGVIELQRYLNNVQKELPGHLSVVTNQTNRKVQSGMAKQIVKEINIPQRVIKKNVLKITKKANRRDIRAATTLEHSKRPGVGEFRGTRQIKKGVSWRAKPRAGTQLIPGGFMGPKPGVKASRLGGHAYKRSGTKRKPIVRLHGASPWGSYVKNNMRPQTIREGQRAYEQAIRKRISFVIKKRTGQIPVRSR